MDPVRPQATDPERGRTKKAYHGETYFLSKVRFPEKNRFFFIPLAFDPLFIDPNVDGFSHIFIDCKLALVERKQIRRKLAEQFH